LGTALASAGFLAACGGGDSKDSTTSESVYKPKDTTAEAKAGGTLKDWQLNGDPSHFDSLAANAVGVNSEGYPTLLRNTPELPLPRKKIIPTVQLAVVRNPSEAQYRGAKRCMTLPQIGLDMAVKR